MSEHHQNVGDFSTTHTTKSMEEEQLRERALELEARHHYVVFSQRTAGRQANERIAELEGEVRGWRTSFEGAIERIQELEEALQPFTTFNTSEKGMQIWVHREWVNRARQALQGGEKE